MSGLCAIAPVSATAARQLLSAASGKRFHEDLGKVMMSEFGQRS
jgi:hypothetical protein